MIRLIIVYSGHDDEDDGAGAGGDNIDDNNTIQFFVFNIVSQLPQRQLETAQ
jgi:hypothetical protein